MFRLAKSLFFSLVIFSYLFSQQKVDFRTEEEQLKDPKVALKRSLTIPGAGQIYKDQKVKGYTFSRTPDCCGTFSIQSFRER